MMTRIKKSAFIFLSVLSFGLYGLGTVSATPNNLHIIPENLKDGDATAGREQAKEDVKHVGDANAGGTAIGRYAEKAEAIEKEKNIGRAFQTGIMGRDTLLQYVVYLMKFLSQLGLLIGGIMILYSGYLYATTIFGIGDPNKAKNAIKNAVIGVIVIVASFAIWKGLESLFL